MAGAGYKLFVSGDVLTAAQVNNYLNEQTVMVFATSAARTSALSAVLAEGMMSYLQDSNTVFYYDGAAWNALASGDLTAITAGNGISVTSGTGPVPTVAIDTAVTVDKTTAQTLTNKTLTSPALTTPTISTLTTNGDLVYGTGSGALSRLGIGSSAQVLTVASGVPSWATPAGGGGMTLINAGGTTLTGASVSIGSIPSSYKMLILMIDAAGTAQDGTVIRGTFNADANTRYKSLQMGLGDTISTFSTAYISLQINMDDTVQKGFSYTVLPNYASTTSWKIAQTWSMSTDYTTDTSFGMGNYSGFYNQTTAISSIELFQNSGYNFDAGKAYLYGVN